ncbi:MAG TPA: Maf family protein [Bryobacteraceae bacterium]|nr:Maf family protein [Bryobacteraceae bacterium]
MLVLASASPRRREILKQAGISFVVRQVDVDETPLPAETPRDYVRRLAHAKAVAAAAQPGEIVLGADTTVVIHGGILAKPNGASDAVRMLSLLSGQRHEVLTGVCLHTPDVTVEDIAETSVWFAPLTPEQIEAYVATGEPMDKAGAYAIQGLASKFVERIEGCYFNVMGLPVAMVYQHLRVFGREKI